MKRPVKIAVCGTVVIAVLHAVGAVSPIGLNWGFHSLGFLPWWFLAGYLALTVVVIMYAVRGSADRQVVGLAESLHNRSTILVAGVSLFFILLATALHVRAPLLGDGFFLVKNFSEAARGVAPLYPRSEPFATYYFYSVLQLRGMATYSDFLKGFLVAEIILGVIFILLAFFITRQLFSDPTARLLSFCSVLVLPYVQLFFGYIELYSAVLVGVAFYLWAAVKSLWGKLSFRLLPGIFLIASLVHYLTLLLLPSLIYLGYVEYRKRGWHHIATGGIAAAAILLVTLIAIDFDVKGFSATVPHSHFLSLFPSDDPIESASAPYTIFSTFHFVDLANYLILMSAGILLLIGIGCVRSGVRTMLQSDVTRFLGISFAPVLGLLFVVKFDFGAAKDWDVLAPFFLCGVLFALKLAIDRVEEGTIRAVTTVVAVTALSTLSFITLNAQPGSSIERYRSLLDPRIVSQYGMYGFSLHFAQYFHQVGNRPGSIEVWERYIPLVPTDRRGYQNLITNLERLSTPDEERIAQTYDRWILALPEDSAAAYLYRKFCIDTGNRHFHNDELDLARQYFERSVALGPDDAIAHNNLGSVLAQQGNLEQAVSCFRRAIEINPSYAEALYNLATALTDLGDIRSATLYFERAANLGNTRAAEHLAARRIPR